MYDIIIDIEERFIGKYMSHRISIIYVESQGIYDMTIQDDSHMIVFEAKAEFKSISGAKELCTQYIEKFRHKI